MTTGGTPFETPANPGVYPAGLALNAVAGTQAREEAIHKELVAQLLAKHLGSNSTQVIRHK